MEHYGHHASIRIDDEIRNLCRSLTEEERQELRTGLEADGLLDALRVWTGENILLDGHHRLELCRELGITPRFVPVENVHDRQSALEWVIRNQLGRRNCTPEDLSYLRGKRYEMEKVTEADRAQRASAARHPNSPRSQNGDKERPRGRTAERLSKELGVGTNTLSRDAKFAVAVDSIESNVSPGAAQSIRSGKSGLTKTQVREIGAMPAEQQRDAYEQAKAAPRKSRQPAGDNIVSLKQPKQLGHDVKNLVLSLNRINDIAREMTPETLIPSIKEEHHDHVERYLDGATDWLTRFRNAWRARRSESA